MKSKLRKSSFQPLQTFPWPIITVVPLIFGFAFQGFSYLLSTTVQKMIPLLMNHQIYSSLMLRHNAYVIYLVSSHHIWILSSHIITKGSTGILRGHIHITMLQYIIIIVPFYYQLLLLILLYLIYKLNSTMDVCVCIYMYIYIYTHTNIYTYICP